MYIGTGGVQAELDSQLPACFSSFGESGSEFGFTEDFDRAAL